ncbi:PAS domain S-box protein [Spirosoma sp. BT702]|uniref:histidine kinase n=1 Tax=Spirosoma profusum TaxID=2771354 RepID=A0A926XXW7_9BACT|nr:PAS domain S-box protein [Spirosoma profusum]MBD2702878.1 PAS domain S-box protein [Spirosoma profusum]
MYGGQKPVNQYKEADNNDHLEVALQASGIGIWDLNPIDQTVYWDERCRELYGFAKNDVVPYDQVLRYMHPDDRPRVHEAVQWALNPQSGGQYESWFRTIGASDGKVRWLHCQGKAFFNKENVAYRFAGIAQPVNITNWQSLENSSQQALIESEERFRTIVEQAPVAVALFSGPEFVITLANERILEVWGRKREQIMNRPLFEAIPEAKGQGYEAIMTNVYTTGERFVAKELPIKLERNGRLEAIYIDFVYEPYYSNDGSIIGVTVVYIEITEQVKQRQTIEASEARFRSLIEEAPVATCLFVGRDMVIEVANEVMVSYWGKDLSVIGKPFIDAVPELKGQPFLDILDKVFTTGETYTAQHMRADLEVNGILGTYYFDFTYKPLRNESGDVYAIMDMTVDVTEQVLARQKVEASEAKLRSIIATAPAAMGLFVGRDLIVEMPNKAFINIVGKGPDIVGKPLRDVMPELENQPFLQILDDVYTSGKMFQSFGSQVNIVQHGVMTRNFYNITYTPILDVHGEVYAILDIAIDVTDAIKDRQRAEEAEQALRGAIELAQLVTWSIHIPTGQFSFSERFMDWLGLSERTKPVEEAFQSMPDEYRQSSAEILAAAIEPGSRGVYENEHPIINSQTGQVRIIHAQGQVFYDTNGMPEYLSGTAQDVTEHRRVQQQLEFQVQERTEELASTNEELAATNDELANINDELAHSIQDLQRSNQNLEQFAYIASHDLQEPLRKIQSFGDILKNQYGSQIGEGVQYLERMQKAAGRMSTLIRDLLAFSRISTRQDSSRRISLNDVIKAVRTDLELSIQESGVTLQVDTLPDVLGDRSQLEQLFQNLLSNALKFRRKDVKPTIAIRSQSVKAIDLPPSIRPARLAPVYTRIDVADNGIGFDEKYVERIFQVFQRLHNRSEFAGTGIGLAICEKVVANHGGAITATSQQGRGATFILYFPAA